MNYPEVYCVTVEHDCGKYFWDHRYVSIYKKFAEEASEFVKKNINCDCKCDKVSTTLKNTYALRSECGRKEFLFDRLYPNGIVNGNCIPLP
jgi:hypothetical protein